MQPNKRSIMFLIVALFAVIVGLQMNIAAAQPTCDADADHLLDGETLFGDGDYAAAVDAFTCAVEADPLNLEAYRALIEANLFKGAYAEALRNITAVQINVVPDNPEAFEELITSYADALEGENADDLRLMTGYSFILWYTYETQAAFDVVDRMLEIDPDNAYARVFRGSSYFFLGDVENGEADFAVALEQQPDSADLYFIMSDAYLYAAGDVDNSLTNALVAQEMGLDTPRMNAILGTNYFVLGEQELALEYFARHIDTATVETIEQEALEAGESVTLDFLPGQTYTFPIEVEAGETLALTTTSELGVDSIMVLVTDDGTLVTGNDDSEGFNAGFEWTAETAGTYTLRLSTFEGAGTGDVVLTRG